MSKKLHVLCPFGALAWVITLVLLSLSANGWAAPAKRPSPPPPTCAAWQDDFGSASLDPNRWVIANGRAPGYIPGNHIGYYQPDRVSVENGFLKILLTQETGLVDGFNGYISRGGLIYTKATCGYGTCEWTMRMSSTSSTPSGSGAWVSGSVSAGFLYVNNSETEIDFEYSALSPENVWTVNWHNTKPRRDPTSSMETADAVPMPDATVYPPHTYRFVWAPGVLTFYIDDGQVAEHTTDVPSAPAYFMINHWGTNSTGWGGPATPGVSRYFYVDSVSYTPLQ
ncbi:MAG: glycoside hydrolase family 16 protein [Acidobacteriia bacterium]|nr:glycoside hydrolase family 16 protein [Terriglobia bacterium]